MILSHSLAPVSKRAKECDMSPNYYIPIHANVNPILLIQCTYTCSRISGDVGAYSHALLIELIVVGIHFEFRIFLCMSLSDEQHCSVDSFNAFSTITIFQKSLF